jgi:FkbM family methyltransferase
MSVFAPPALAPSPRALRIPRVLHRVWVGDQPMPDSYVAYGESWQREHPDWEIRLWTDATRPRLRNEALYLAAPTLAQKADILRYELLLEHGGVYVDCDFECLRNLEPLLEDVDAFVVPEDDAFIAIGILGATPGHPFLEDLVRHIPHGIAGAPGRPPNEQTGPHYMTARYATATAAGAPVPVKLPAPLFYPYGPHELHRASEAFPEAYGVHHWGASWVPDELRPAQVVPVRRIVIAPDWAAPAPAAAVARAACALFGPEDPVELAIVVPHDPTEEDGARVSSLLAQVAPDPSRIPDTVVYAFGEVLEATFDVAVVAAGDTLEAGAAAADAVAALHDLRAALDAGRPVAAPVPGATLGDALKARLLAELEREAVSIVPPSAPPAQPAPAPAPGIHGAYVGNGRMLVRTRWGGTLYAAAGDMSITPHLVTEGVYDVPFTNFLQRTLRPGGVAVDVGANIGLFTVQMGRLVGPSGRVVAYEAAPRNAALLRDNVAMSYQSGWVEVREAAAAAHAGRLPFHVTSRFAGNGSLVEHDDAYHAQHEVEVFERIEVACEPLATRLGELGTVDLVKVDVEGGELQVFRGMADLLAARRVRAVSFELLRCRMGEDWAPFADLLRGHRDAGWRFSLIAEDGGLVPSDVEQLLAVGEYPQVVMEAPAA